MGRRLIRQQFKSAANLEARTNLHSRYSTNKHGWHRWVFDQFSLPQHARILEVGCGIGRLWSENGERLPDGWRLLLTDYSEGMVRQSRQNLAGLDHDFSFLRADIEALPFNVQYYSGNPGRRGIFDAVVANHMLYFVGYKDKALSTIRRLLKPGGRFYATTNGSSHMRELIGLISTYDHTLTLAQRLTGKFTLESGPELVSSWFDEVEVHRYPDSLVVTDLYDLLAYVFSMPVVQALPALRQAALRDYIREQFTAHDYSFTISKDAGIICGNVKD